MLLVLVVPATSSALARPAHPVSNRSLFADAQGFYDAAGTATIATVRGADRGRFVPAATLPQFPESSVPRVYWFRVRVDRGDSTRAWALRFSYKVTRVDLFVPSSRGLTHVAAGFDLGPRDRGFASGYLMLPENALHETFYARVASVIDPRSVQFVPAASAATFALQRRGVFGFFVGFFLAIGAFNLLMFFSLRDRSLVNYAGVMLLDACRSAVGFGVFWVLLPPLTFLTRELIYDTVSLASAVALAAFSIDFLRLTERDRRAVGIVLVGVAIQLSVYLTDFFPNVTVAFDWTLVVTLAYFGVLIYAGRRAYRLGMRVARIYVAGIVCTALGYAINMSSYALPRQDLWVYALDAGACLQALLLALAVAEGVQESRSEHQRLLAESEQLERLAHLDGLTSVLNRRAFDHALRDAAAADTPLGILMLDIDHFKAFNDSLGHHAGDEALRLVAQACAGCVRDGDVFARYGGEEFCAVVPGADGRELERIAERMRTAVTALDLHGFDGRVLTISVGGACGTPSGSEAAVSLVREADAALYAAKAGGRDRVHLLT